jgi:hypothetical protein
MGSYIKIFNTHEEYLEWVETSLVEPNISFCKDKPRQVHYHPLSGCTEGVVYKITSTPSYPSIIENDVTSFDISFDYRKADIDEHCRETDIVNSADTVTVNCGANTGSTDRVVSGVVTWNRNDIEYNVVQKGVCVDSTVYELVGVPSYPATIQYDVTSFDINFNYKKTVTTSDCQKTVTNSADTVTVNCGTNTGSSDRTVSGTVTWNGINIEYSVTQKKGCTVSTVYELVGNPSYPATINGSDETFNISFNYKKTDTDEYCQETVTNSADTVTIECGSNPSTSDARTVSGSIDYHGIEIEYSVTQNKFSNNSANGLLLGTTSSSLTNFHPSP